MTVTAPDFEIRKANKKDLPGLEWDGEYRKYRRLYKRAMNEAMRGRRILLVAEMGEKLVGQIFVQLHTVPADPKRIPKTAYLYSFRVRPQFRNLGIGSSLVSEAEAALLQKGFRRALIGVAKDNPDALRLYQRLGYEILTEDPGVWSFVDHKDRVQNIVEPTYILEKYL